MRQHSFFHSLLRRLGLRPAALVLLFGDALALQATAYVAMMVRSAFGGVDTSIYIVIAGLLLSGPCFTLMLGTCQSLSLPPHREVKQLFIAVSLTYLVILGALFMSQASGGYSRAVLAMAWLGSIFTVPLVRGRLRKWLCERPWWGRPVVFLQQGRHVEEIWNELEARPERGLRPVARLDIRASDPHWQEALAPALEQYPDAVFVWYPGISSTGNDARFWRRLSKVCSNLLFVPLLFTGGGRFWLTPRDLGSSVGLLVRQNLQDIRRLRTKRAIDLFLGSLAVLVAVPVGLVVALCVRLDSKGPVIYTQVRLGQGGKKIRVFKFRTMVMGADKVLREYLEKNPDKFREWKKNQKLRDDPRITRVGSLLRKTSLDELPQLLNVLLGDMSLVGPRPIVESEVTRYGDVYKEYALVKPGITGLWQVSGRNSTSYSRRIVLDHYYVTNWSVWMDLWILARTIPVVLRGHGAY